MATQIKYRTWIEKYKEFKYWGFIDGLFISPPTGSNISIQECLEFSASYTGLKDKNGKEIYEGDVIRYYHYGKPIDTVKIVEDIRDTFCTNSAANDCVAYPSIVEGEVIGNIYENPELINK